jgi:hypothetical protein
MLIPLKKGKLISENGREVQRNYEKSRETTQIILGKKGKNYTDYSG